MKTNRQNRIRRTRCFNNKKIFPEASYKKPLFQGLMDARRLYGGSSRSVSDSEGTALTYTRLIRQSLVFGQHIRKFTKDGEFVGVLLPNMAATLSVFFGLLTAGRIPAMLNYATGVKNVLSACETAGIRQVYTSRRFINLSRLTDIAEALDWAGIRLAYLEDVKTTISLWDKMTGIILSFCPWIWQLYANRRKTDDPAVILFTSGTEGRPKGVALTHGNLQANCYQLAQLVEFDSSDKVFNALPVFHAYGLTAATLLPILWGVETHLYPSPLHYRTIPERIRETRSTVVFSTNTFLQGYAHYARPEDFRSVRYIFAGAEKLKEKTRQLYAEKFGINVLEGYGTTETAPVLAINTPDHNKPGTVGRLIPDIDYKIENVVGIADGGRLWVKGPNIMKGYLIPPSPGTLAPPEDGWYDTGDIVSMDNDGYLTIQGRAKRFAKIGGEMISLAAAEELVESVYPTNTHAVIGVPDHRKGESLLLFTDYKKADRDDLLAHAKKNGLTELLVPRKIKILDQLPLLGTGKVDCQALQKMAEA